MAIPPMWPCIGPRAQKIKMFARSAGLGMTKALAFADFGTFRGSPMEAFFHLMCPTHRGNVLMS
jgi:hypothetical protein